MPSPPENPDRVLSHNGRLVPAHAPVVSAKDQALVFGQGIYETLIAYRGVPFLPERHYARLRHSAETMGMTVPDEPDLLRDMHAVLEANRLTEIEKVRIRITVTGGVADLRFSDHPGQEQVLIDVGPVPAFPEFAKVVTTPFARNDRGALTGCKTINYGENVVALRLARAAGADEALYRNTRDQLCEGTWSNVFVFHDRTWKTPPLESGCLPGVTRALVLELAKEAGISIEEADLPMDRLVKVETAFLTSTLREIQPIESIDGRTLQLPSGNGVHDLARRFSAMAKERSHPRPTRFRDGSPL